jgi:diguanylate cyclase (GGDEF)-like protein
MLKDERAAFEAQIAELKASLAQESERTRLAEAQVQQFQGELAEQEQQVLFIETIAEAAHQMSSVRQLFEYVLREICRYTAWQLGHVYLLEQGQLVSTEIWQVYDAESVLCQADSPAETSAGLDKYRAFIFSQDSQPKTLAARVQQSAKVQGFEPLLQDSATDLQSVIAFPVIHQAKVLAVLEFYSNQAEQPEPPVFRLLGRVGFQLGRVMERKHAEERLKHEAFHDPLTGLPNRAMFLDWIERVVARSQRNPESRFAVLFIDLDRFKLVNDSLGHLAGDALLIQVTSRIVSSLRREDVLTHGNAQLFDGERTLARLGGDEFIALLDDIRDPSDAVRVAERIQEALKAPFVVEGHEIYSSASIGIVWSNDAYATAHEVLRDADLAMYRAKAQGKARYEVFDQTLHTLAVKRLKLEADLRRALQQDEFVLHFQPIFSLKTSHVVGFEALVRWQKPGQDLIYPDEFIQIAEDTGLILHLDLWVMRQACERIQQWHQDYPQSTPLTMSVNVSARQFAQAKLVEQVHQIIETTGIAPESLRLEITESASMHDVDRTIRVLNEFKQRGVSISIDDFGTGYSSLSSLHRFPLDLIKIDRSFVSEMDQSSDQIVRTIMSLAQSLGFDVVAEGAETEAQVRHLTALGCEYAQGYYFSKPLDRLGAEKLLAAQIVLAH